MSDRVRVVVAEDEALIRLDIVEMLKDAGYDVVAAVGNGKAAVEAVERLRPDVVLMDVKMPIMDGLSAAEHIGDDVAVVILSAFSQTELVTRAKEAGVANYIVKPFGAADLPPAIEVGLARWAEIQALRSELGDTAAQLEARKVVERAKGRLMSAHGLGEAEAFRWMQKAAMDRRLSLVDVAQAVLDEVPA